MIKLAPNAIASDNRLVIRHISKAMHTAIMDITAENTSERLLFVFTCITPATNMYRSDNTKDAANKSVVISENMREI